MRVSFTLPFLNTNCVPGPVLGAGRTPQEGSRQTNGEGDAERCSCWGTLIFYFIPWGGPPAPFLSKRSGVAALNRLQWRKQVCKPPFCKPDAGRKGTFCSGLQVLWKQARLSYMGRPVGTRASVTGPASLLQCGVRLGNPLCAWNQSLP